MFIIDWNIGNVFQVSYGKKKIVKYKHFNRRGFVSLELLIGIKTVKNCYLDFICFVWY